MSQAANTFVPTFRKQVPADMPVYNATIGAYVPYFYASKLSESISVKDFGAVGDGIAPDNEAIQAAIDYAIRNGIATVHFPDGKYLTNDTIHVGYGNDYVQINLVGQQLAAPRVAVLPILAV